jgi:hypothetical protein
MIACTWCTLTEKCELDRTDWRTAIIIYGIIVIALFSANDYAISAFSHAFYSICIYHIDYYTAITTDTIANYCARNAISDYGAVWLTSWRNRVESIEILT